MTNSLGNACGELIEVFTELEDSLPEDVYKGLEPVITRVKDAALRSIVVEEQFDLLFRTFKVLSTNPEARLNRRMIELAEGNNIPEDGIRALAAAPQENPAPPNRAQEILRAARRQPEAQPIIIDDLQPVNAAQHRVDEIREQVRQAVNADAPAMPNPNNVWFTMAGQLPPAAAPLRPLAQRGVRRGAVVPDAMRFANGGGQWDAVEIEDRFDEVFHDPRPQEEQDE